MIPYILHPNSLIYMPYPSVNSLKTIPYRAAHTYIAHIWQYHPRPPPPVPVLVQLFDVSFHFECGKFFISHTNTHVTLGRTEVKFLRSG